MDRNLHISKHAHKLHRPSGTPAHCDGIGTSASTVVDEEIAGDVVVVSGVHPATNVAHLLVVLSKYGNSGGQATTNAT
jgi:hypothetical protein